MTERCAAAAERLTASNTPDAPSHHTLLLTLLRTCAFDVGIDELAKQKMLERFDAYVVLARASHANTPSHLRFVYADFTDCKQVYQQLFVSKSRLLAYVVCGACAPRTNEGSAGHRSLWRRATSEPSFACRRVTRLCVAFSSRRPRLQSARSTTTRRPTGS